jgi:hypothetical protein
VTLLGTFKELTFMQVYDRIFVWCLDRWVRYCSLLEWLSSTAGKHIRRIVTGGQVVCMRENCSG